MPSPWPLGTVGVSARRQSLSCSCPSKQRSIADNTANVACRFCCASWRLTWHGLALVPQFNKELYSRKCSTQGYSFHRGAFRTLDCSLSLLTCKWIIQELSPESVGQRCCWNLWRQHVHITLSLKLAADSMSSAMSFLWCGSYTHRFLFISTFRSVLVMFFLIVCMSDHAVVQSNIST